MILINKLKIDSNGVIDVDIETVVGNSFTKILVWSAENFQNESKAVDLSYLLSKIGNRETFKIYPSDLQVDAITGLYLIRFYTTETGESGSTTGLVANLAQYNNCLLDKVLELDITGCNETRGSSSCKECTEDLYYLQSLLQALDIAIREAYITESVKLVKKIKDFCNICDTCPDYTDTININNFTIGIENNIIQ